MPGEFSLRPRITVIGVGGAGCNAVNNMIRAQLEGVEFLVANTDAQSLEQSLVEEASRVQLGPNITRGLGAGSKPDVGQAAAEESAEDILPRIQESNMVFITAGMGGGTGTGAAPVIARIAREAGILTVGVVTKPFFFEGAKRAASAERGIVELKKHVDTLIIIPNQNLFRVANEQTTFSDAFKMADEVLYSGVRGVTDLMIMPGLINLDFADVKAVMAEMGNAMMGTGEAVGEHRALEAAEAAIANPLLDDVSLKGAKGVLISITGGKDMTLFEVDEATNRIREDVDSEANIIFGSTFDERLDGRIRVSVVATGIGLDKPAKETQEPEPEPEDVPLGLGAMMRRGLGGGLGTGLGGTQAFAASSGAYVPEDERTEKLPVGAFVSDDILSSSSSEPGRTEFPQAETNLRDTGGAHQQQSFPYNSAPSSQTDAGATKRGRPSFFERLTRSGRKNQARYGVPASTVNNQTHEDEALDIPAFLRRESKQDRSER